MKSFKSYMNNKSADRRIDLAATYIAANNFPIRQFGEWYKVVMTLPPHEHDVIMEGFWDDVKSGAKSGAAKGAGMGALGGGLIGPWGVPLGGLAGGALGGLAGGAISGAKNYFQNRAKNNDPVTYHSNDFKTKKDEAIKILQDLKQTANELDTGHNKATPAPAVPSNLEQELETIILNLTKLGPTSTVPPVSPPPPPPPVSGGGGGGGGTHWEASKSPIAAIATGLTSSQQGLLSQLINDHINKMTTPQPKQNEIDNQLVHIESLLPKTPTYTDWRAAIEKDIKDGIAGAYRPWH